MQHFILVRPYSATLTSNLSMEYPYVLEDTVVNLTCNVIANPRPTFMFYKPFESETNGLLHSGPNSSIQVLVKKSSLSKFVLFSCLAGSNYGNTSRAMLEIFVPSGSKKENLKPLNIYCNKFTISLFGPFFGVKT